MPEGKNFELSSYRAIELSSCRAVELSAVSCRLLAVSGVSAFKHSGCCLF